MRLLFLSPYVPNRIRVRPFSIISELTRRHEVHVIALGEGEGVSVCGAQEIAQAAASFTVIDHPRVRGLAQSLMSLPTARPMCAAFCKSPEMSRAVESALAGSDFDLIHVEHLRAAHFAPRDRKLPVLFDSVDCLSGLFRQMARSGRNPVGRMVMAEEAWKLRRYEPAVLRRFDRIVITSKSERDELKALDPHLNIDVLPNGVDTDYFAPRGTAKSPARIVFSGKMSYAPNAGAVLWFASEVLPLVRCVRPDAEFLIAGNAPPPEVRKLGDTPGITVTGYVEDLRPHIESAAVAVVPMQMAVGIQNKVLESMAMGVPVVASGLALRAFGDDCAGAMRADSPGEMAENLLRLLNTPAESERLGSIARETVLRDFSWKAAVDRLESIYAEMIAERSDARVDGGTG